MKMRSDSVYVTNASTQLLYCLVLAMCEQYHAARRYAIRCLRRVVRFDPVIICLALTFVFLSAAGAVAQTAALVAQAGPDQPTVVSGKEVQLDGTGSTVTDGSRTVTYAWARTGGTGDDTVAPSNPAALQTSFTAETLDPGDASVTHVFTLTVTDNQGSTQATDMVTITVTAPPVAVPGRDQKVPSGWPVVLDGSGSMASAGNTISEYSWFSVEVAPECDPFPPHTIEGSLARFTAEDLAPGAADVTYCFFLQVEQSNGDLSDYVGPLKVTVTNSLSSYVRPDAIIAGGNREVGSGGTVDLDGSGSTHDGRTTLTYAWTRADGTTDGLTNAATARPTFTAETLADGADDVTHVLTLTVTDGQGVTDAATVEITVTSGFVAPDAIIAGGNREVGSGGTVDLDGSGSTHDARTSLTYAWTRADGTTDGLTDPNTATPVFTAETLADGAPDVTHTLTLTVTDGAGVTDAATVEITVTSGFVAPDAIIAGGNREVGSGGTVGLDGSGSTHDGRTSLTYAWTRADGTTDGLTDPNTATPVFTAETLADGAPDVTHTLTLTVTDGAGVTDAATVEITVTSGFVAPDAIIAGGNREVGSGGTVDLDGSGSTHDGRTSLTYAWTRADGTTDGLTDPNTATPVFTAETLADGAPDVTHTLTLTVTDGAGVTDAATVEITVTSGFVAPDAIIAGGNREVGSGGTVDLDGSGSTHDARTSLTYAWTRADGTTDGLTDPNTATPVFTAETLADGAPDVTHTLTLTVTDGAGVTDAATVEITVTSGFVAPDAIIAGGNREVGSGGTVDLDGSGSTHDGRTSLTYAWTRTDGTTDGLTDPNTATPVFTAETLADGAPDVTHTLTLTVTDGAGVTDAATVEITVTSGFVAPDAIIAGGNREVGSGGTVDLDGSGSTHDARTSLTYAWTRADGTTDGLTDPNTATPVFTAETLADGAPDVTHTLTLTVTDGANVSDTATVEITVTSGFVAPDAIIAGGNREVGSGGTVDLDGSGSTHDARTSLTYAWTRADGTTDGLTDPNTATPVFTAETLADGAPDVTHTLTLTVTDGAGVTDAATVEITVTSGFVAPDAIIAGGNREVGSGGTVDLDGSGSTHDDRTSLTYAWTRADGTTDGLTDPNTATPVFTAETLADGAPDVTHTLTLTVTDGANVSDTATVEITVTSGFVAPDAIIAGGNREVGSGGTVDLDGSGSTHDARTSLTYAWTRADGTTDGLTDPNTATPVFTAETLADGAPDVTHTLTLTVTDGAGVTDAATVEITVTYGFVAPDAIIAGGNREVGSGGTVDLDGSGSTHDARTSLTYAWTRADGTTDGLTDPNTATPVFTAETLADGAPDVTHTLTLTVTDGAGVTDAATVEITVTSGFVAPDAIIAGGNREVGSGGTVDLDGSGSTHDGRTSLTYAWTRADGTTDGLTDPNTATPVFTAETLADGAPDVTHTLTLTVTDGANVSDTATVEITVTSGFVAPDAIIAGGNREVGSGGTVGLDGSGSTHDGRTSLTYAWTRADGTTDGLTDPNTATPVFTAETLADGAPDVTHTLTLTVTDGAGVTDAATVEITVTSGFVAPDAIIAGGNREVGSGGTVDLDGSGSTHDGRTSLTYAWTRADGTTDGLTDPNTATPVFTAETLADGAPDVTHTLTLTVTDGAGVTDAATVEITVTSGFVAPDAIIAGGNREVGSGGTVDLDGSGSTHDARTSLTYAWTRADGTTDGLTDPNTATPVFTAETLADGAPDVTHTLTLTVTDGAGVTDAATVEITVTSGFVAPDAIIAGGNREVGSGGTVDLDGSGSTHDARTSLTYAWTRADGTTDGLTDPNTATPVFTAETLADGAPDVTHTLTLTVTDGANVSDTATVEITVTSGFVAPDAIIAGGNREVGSGGTVDLDGSGSTHDARTSLTYAWTRADGTTDGLTDPNTATPVFTAETLADGAPDVTHTLTLTVTDGANVSDTATVEITVTSGFVAPDAIIAGGNREVGSGGTVDLDGSGSTHDGRTSLTYAWTRADGTTDGLTDPNTATPVFTAETLADGAPDVTHTLTLTVTDGANVSDTATVEITVTSGFVAPDAIIAGGNREVGSGGTVDLDGSGSTHDARTSLTYAWTRADGTTDGLTDPNTATPVFTAETLADGAPDVTHTLTLTVTDGAGVTDAATVEITVTSGFVAPDAIIAGGNREVGSGGTVDLDGSGSTHDDRTSLTYAWTRADGTTDGLTDPNTATPVFTAETLADGAPDVTHTLTLTVTDGAGVTDAATVEITVTSGFAAPDAIIAGGNREVGSGGTVQLDGSGSTHDARTTLTYAWTRTGGNGNAGVVLTGEDTARLSFTADALTDGAPDVTHEFTLTVTDNKGGRSTATVTITVTPLAALVAEAGDARSVVSGTQGVQLDGTGSTLTGGGRAVTYLWDRTGGDGATVTLTNADTLRPTFTAQTLNPGDAAVTYIFTLTVTDDQSSAVATDTVTITAVPVDILDSPFELIGVSPLLFGLIVSAVDILVSTSELTVQEGGSSAYQVRLSESPGQDVIVTAVSDNENVVLENERLLFNANNWDAWQEIRIGTVAGSENADGKTLIEHRLDTGGVALRQSGVVSVTVREEDPVLRPVGENLTARATTLLNNLPNLSSFLKQDRTTPGGSGGFTFKATNGHLTLDGGFVRDGVWGEIAGSYTRSDFGDTRFVLGSFGIHRKYSERFLAGAMLQIDLADHDLDGKSGSIDGTGWLVGPYFAARHGTWPLYFEGRLLYGQSDNDIRFNDSDLGEKMRMGSFDTTRMLAQLRLEGEIALSDGDEGPRLIPYADTHWFEDRAAAFTDSIGTRISGQTISIGQLELGSNVEVPIAMSHGAMTFTGGLGLVYSKTEGDYIPSVSRSRGRGEIGFSYGLDDNVRIDFESFYDGIGTSGYEGYGLSLNAEIKF